MYRVKSEFRIRNSTHMRLEAMDPRISGSTSSALNNIVKRSFLHLNDDNDDNLMDFVRKK